MIDILNRLIISIRQAQVSASLDAIRRSRSYIAQLTRELDDVERRTLDREESL